MSVFYLAATPPVYGKYTGYRLLPDYVSALHPETQVVEAKMNLFREFLGRRYVRWTPSSRKKQYSFAGAECVFYFKTGRLRKDAVHHVVIYEAHHHFWERWKKGPKNVIATIHHARPPEMSRAMIDNLHRLGSLIVLASDQMDFLESHVGKGRVKFIRHGVDVEFFRPGGGYVEPRRLVFTGRIERNTKMLSRVVRILAGRHSELRFDLLVSERQRKQEEFRALEGHPAVVFHQGISDESLLKLYQDAYLLLMPLEKTAANNTVVEAMACGTPPVTCDVGGIGDYGGGSLYPVASNDDDEAMVALVERYLEDSDWRERVARDGRAFAERELNWPLIARQHLEAYEELAGVVGLVPAGG